MFSLQVQILNLTPSQTHPNYPQSSRYSPLSSLTLRFGPLQSQITLTSTALSNSSNTNNNINSNNNVNGYVYAGGKKLLLQMQQKQLKQLIHNYAFGLFIDQSYQYQLGQKGKYWCVISLEQIQLGQLYRCNNIVFYNDQRKVCYQCQLVVKLEQYKIPKLPKNVNNVIEKQAYAGQMQLGINTNTNFNKQKKEISSFLYPKQAQISAQAQKQSIKADLLNTKMALNKCQAQIKNNNKKQQHTNYKVVDFTQANIQNYQQQSQGVYIPPVMQFVNHDQNVRQGPAISNQQIPISTVTKGIHNFRNFPKMETITNYTQLMQNQQNRTNSSNNNIQTQQQSSQIPQSSTALQKSKQKQKPLKKQSESQKLRQLRQLALKQAQQSYNKKQQQILIPMPNKTGTGYQLIPLSTMSQNQILQYARRQKKVQELQKYKKQKQAQQIRKQQQKIQKKKKKQMYNKMDKQAMKSMAGQKLGITKKQRTIDHQHNKNQQKSSQFQSSQQMDNVDQDQIQRSRHPSQIRTSQKRSEYPSKSQSQSQSQQQQDNYAQSNSEDYQSDFQSISLAGSQLKSKISLQSSVSIPRSNQKQKQKKQLKMQKQKQKIDDSMDQYGYSQDYDSYSQSMLSKNKLGHHHVSNSNRKSHADQNHSLSEISMSYISGSQHKY